MDLWKWNCPKRAIIYVLSFQIISGLTVKPKPPICLLARPKTYFSLQKQKWILVSDFFNFSNKKIKWVSYPIACTRNSAETFSFIRKRRKEKKSERTVSFNLPRECKPNQHLQHRELHSEKKFKNFETKFFASMRSRDTEMTVV